MLRAYLTTGLRLDVLAALFRLPERALWRREVVAGRAVRLTLDADLAAPLPESRRQALDDELNERKELVA